MVELDILKAFLPPSKFSLFGYAVVILYLLTGLSLLAFSANLRTREQDKFQCDFRHDAVSDKNYQYFLELCYGMFDTEYNSPLPLYGVVALELAVTLFVCLSYSLSVQSRMFSNLQAAESRSRKIFYYYFLHLVVRCGLTTVFAVLQKSVFFPFRFSTKFSCVLPTAQPWNWNITNSNATNNKYKPTSSASNCLTSFAKEKNIASLLVLLLNIFCCVLLGGEIVYLVYKAHKRRNFTVDTEFPAEHFVMRDTTRDNSNHIKRLRFQQTKHVALIPNVNERLDAFFVDLEMHMKEANGEFIIVNSYEDLYHHTEASVPKVLVVGPSGSGKSLLCKKLLHDWSKKPYSDSFHFAFLVEFSWFNSNVTEMSVRDLLHHGISSERGTENNLDQVLANPEKILMIFDDGLDLLKKYENCDEEIQFGNSLTMPVSKLYLKILQNKLLPGATVLTTSRRNVITRYQALFNKTVEIQDFTEVKVHKYVDNFCKQNRKLATRIREHLNLASHLLSLCYIPAYCHIVCCLLKDEIEKGISDGIRPTDVYQRALKKFIFTHHPNYKRAPFPDDHNRFSKSVEKTLDKLGLLAENGITAGRSTFSSEEVKDERNCGLLKQMSHGNGGQDFSFIHPTIQDFLVARTFVKRNPDKLKLWVLNVLNVKEKNWFLVLQFVMGLLNGQQPSVVGVIGESLQNALMSSPTKEKMSLVMMNCLYEYNDEDTVKRFALELQQKREFKKKINLKNCEVTTADCKAIVNFLKHFDSLESVDIRDNSIAECGLNELRKLDALNLTVKSVSEY